MKELLKKIKPETVMSVGLVVLGAAQMLLSNKKEQTELEDFGLLVLFLFILGKEKK